MGSKKGLNAWPYTEAMKRCRRKREFRAWFNRVFTSERLLNFALVVTFIILTVIYVRL